MGKKSTRLTTRKFCMGALAALFLFGSGAHAQSAGTPPDWSGIWAPDNGASGVDGNFSGGSGGPTGPIFRPAKITNPFSLTPEYQAIYDKNLKGGMDVDAKDCLAPGMPTLLTVPYPIEFLITPKKVVVLHEVLNQNRRIYTDGRKHPPADELDDSFNGHSIGHWDGDTLVVDTVGFKRDILFDRATRHSEAMHMVERIRRVSPDRLEDQLTLTDPKAFTKPWSTTFAWTHKTGEEWDLKEYECQENNRN